MKEIEERREVTSDLGDRWMVVPAPQTGNTGGTVLRDKMISSILNMLSLRCPI